MLKEIFLDYLPFITTFITIIINVYLIVKKVDWVVLIVGNLIIGIIFILLGLPEYNIVSILVDKFIDLLGDFLNNIFGI